MDGMLEWVSDVNVVLVYVTKIEKDDKISSNWSFA
jgi:hypothetical protein